MGAAFAAIQTKEIESIPVAVYDYHVQEIVKNLLAKEQRWVNLAF